MTHTPRHPAHTPPASRLAAARWALIATTVFIGVMIVALSAAAAHPLPDPAIDSPMLHNPEVEAAPQIPAVRPGTRELWIAALESPNAQVRRLAANTIGLAHQRGVRDLDAAASQLRSLLTRPDPDPLVRLAAASSLTLMNDEQAAPTLLARAQSDGLDMALIADPALAAWNHIPARAMWRQRLTDAGVPYALKRSAIHALSKVRDRDAFDPLLAIATDHATPQPLALAAARAAGIVRPADRSLAHLAADFAAGEIPHRLIAVALLYSDETPESTALLSVLASDPEPAIAADALQTLDRLAPELAHLLAMQLLTNAQSDIALGRSDNVGDSKLKLVALECVMRNPDDPALSAVATLARDPSVDLRRAARDAFVKLSKTTSYAQNLNRHHRLYHFLMESGDWRAVEQALLFAGMTKLSVSASTHLPQLRSPQPELRLAAAFAIRRTADREAYSPVFEFVTNTINTARELNRANREALYRADLERETTDKTGANDRQSKAIPPDPRTLVRLNEDTDRELVQLIQYFVGTVGTKETHDLFMSLVPKNSVPWPNTRAAAIWVLARSAMYSDRPRLTAELLSRATDNNPLIPEALSVRRSAIIALGMMKSTAALATLQDMYNRREDAPVLLDACRWSITQITETAPPAYFHETPDTDWFLQSLNTRP